MNGLRNDARLYGGLWQFIDGGYINMLQKDHKNQ